MRGLRRHWLAWGASMRRALLALVLVLAAVTVATPASAQSDECADAVLESVCEANAAFWAYAGGLSDRAADVATGIVSDTGAETAADDFQSTFNSHNETIEAWVNDRTNASTDRDVVALTFRESGSGTTVYLVATVNNSSYQDSHVVDSTDRSVDESCTLEAAAARNADSETQRFHDEFAEPDTDLTDAYVRQMAGRYGGKVDCTIGGI